MTAVRLRSTESIRAISSSGVPAGTNESTNHAGPKAPRFSIGGISAPSMKYLVFSAESTGIFLMPLWNSSMVLAPRVLAESACNSLTMCLSIRSW